jgi:2-C-methyl-D-erythritol 2,4-cyclodiphosphate synthase
MTLRVGFGYDIHRLVPGRPLFLGGIRIAFEKGLLGHSDGDAAAHAVADALLGAAGLGDLGEHFPADDPQWAGASGARILEETARLLRARHLEVVQADITVVAETPRLAPHRAAMVEAISAALSCEPSAISIKARSNEGLGEIGRGEAICAFAVAMVRQGG